MWFWIIFMIVGTLFAIIYCKLDDKPSQNRKFDQKKESLESMMAKLDQINKSINTKNAQSKASSEQNGVVSGVYYPHDPEKYTFDYMGRLVHYNGDEDILCVPFGTSIIGNDEEQIKEGKKWDSVYIPRSVIIIHDLALPLVESVWYEGSEEEFAKIDIGKIGNFMTGFVPNYAEKLDEEYRIHSIVKEIKFNYNTNLASMYKRMSDERLRQMGADQSSGSNNLSKKT